MNFMQKIYNMQNEQLLGDKAFRDNFEGYAFSWRGRAGFAPQCQIA